MNVLSLFDGISCGQLALKRSGIGYDNYFASEIEKDAIKVTQANFPNTIQLGDVQQVKSEDLPKIDLLIGGSPCQGFSFAGKGLNFEDPRSKLFFEFVRLLRELNPKYFILENVIMKKEYQDIITQYLGVEPVEINSALVSAQNRKRLYWCNFEIPQPEDKNITLKDILEENIPFKYDEFNLDYEIINQDQIQEKRKEQDLNHLNPSAIRGRYTKDLKNEPDYSIVNKATIIGRRINEKGHREDYNKEISVTQCLEVRATNTDKSNCLTTVDKDNVLTPLPIGRHLDVFNRKLPFRYYTLTEQCRLQTLPEDYFEKSKTSVSKAKKMIGNGWTVDVIVHILNQIKDKF